VKGSPLIPKLARSRFLLNTIHPRLRFALYAIHPGSPAQFSPSAIILSRLDQPADPLRQPYHQISCSREEQE
jgi:hypothetical protein